MNRIDIEIVDAHLALGRQLAESLGYAHQGLSEALKIPLLRSLTLKALRANASMPSDQGLSEVELFYDEYFWLLAFSALFKQVHGDDAGIDQGVSDILADAPEGVDWTELERTTREVEQSLGEQFFPEA